MENITKKKLNQLKGEMGKLIIHKDRIFTKIDEEMYLLSKSEKDENKKDKAQKNLAIFIMAELLESFEEEKEIEEILGVLNKTFLKE